jgi:chemotaxis protein methyltransferase CheR
MVTVTGEEFRLFRNLIYKESGIYLKETRKDFLEHRLEKRLTATGAGSPYWYYKMICEKKSEFLVLLDILTVNETSFFRNGPQMDLFKNVSLPQVLKRKGADFQKRLRIWSAGCSTGEEPYTIAMLVLETVPNLKAWEVRIFASDLSFTVLAAASKGEYGAEKVQATVDDRYVSRYFEKSGERLRVRDEVKKMVVFDFHNLKNDNGLDGLDFIFCRNVMIYFDMEEQKRLVDKFYASLNPGGYLFIGHAESLQGWGTRFEFVYDNKGTAYKKPVEVGA